MSQEAAFRLIDQAFSSPQGILKFGDFTLKSGRQSPYFFNFGSFNTGPLLLSLAEAFADAIIIAYPNIGLEKGQADSQSPQVLFGPAYKGIALVATISTELAKRGRSVGFAYNRKEAKTHGEGGTIVGSALEGQNVLIVDDVMTAGTAIREAHAIVSAGKGRVVGIVEALDREERGTGDKSTVQEVEATLGVRVTSVVKFRDIIAWLEKSGKSDQVGAMKAYRDTYGAN